MDYKVALSFEDGITRFITCADSQTVADASYRQRVNIPVDCNDGACGTCKAFCESGQFDGGRYIADALSAEEAARGFCLPCQVKPRSDLVLRIPTTSELARTAAASFTGTVTEIRRLSATVVGFTVTIADRARLAFLPGQYVNIAVPGSGAVRSYSFSSPPGRADLEFLVKLVDGGAMSTWLRDRAQVGDQLTFTGPHGSFYLREAQRPALMLAGGTGLAPILSMLHTLAATGTTRPIHLVYGATTDADVVELATLEALTGSLDRFTWDHVVADPATTAPNQGYVMSLLGDEHLHGGDVDVYLCGPPPMVEAVRGYLADRGIEPAGFYSEKFSPSGSTTSAGALPAAAAGSPEPRGIGGQTIFPARAVPAAVPSAGALLVQPGARGIAGQEIFPARADRVLRRSAAGPVAEDPLVVRSIAGQVAMPSRPATAPPRPLDPPTGVLLAVPAARGVAGQEIFARRAGTVAPRPARAHLSPGRFTGKVVLVTGAAQGIGEAVARRIGAEGGHLVLADRSELVELLAAELDAAGRDAGQVAISALADLETFAGAQSVVDAAVRRFGRIDVAIHNVGGTIWAKPFEHYLPEQIEAEINRSLYPTLWGCRAVLPQLIRQGGGVIVNVSSVATRGVHRVPYAAAKGGVNAVTASLAMEAARHGVRVVATAPGGTDAPPRRVPRGPAPQTETERAWYQAIVDQTVDSSLQHRYGTVEEQAAAIAFLASDEASYITGTVLPVAGGDLG